MALSVLQPVGEDAQPCTAPEQDVEAQKELLEELDDLRDFLHRREGVGAVVLEQHGRRVFTQTLGRQRTTVRINCDVQCRASSANTFLIRVCVR